MGEGGRKETNECPYLEHGRGSSTVSGRGEKNRRSDVILFFCGQAHRGNREGGWVHRVQRGTVRETVSCRASFNCQLWGQPTPTCTGEKSSHNAVEQEKGEHRHAQQKKINKRSKHRTPRGERPGELSFRLCDAARLCTQPRSHPQSTERTDRTGPQSADRQGLRLPHIRTPTDSDSDSAKTPHVRPLLSGICRRQRGLVGCQHPD